MRLTHFITIAFISVALVGCAKPTPYLSKAESKSLYGYFEVTVEENLYRVSFVGNPRTSQRAVKAYTLYRSAQIAKSLNSPYFKVIEGAVDVNLLEAEDTFSLVPAIDDLKIATKSSGGGSRYIYVPQYSYVPPPLPTASSLLVRMNVVPKADDAAVFNTDAVLKNLGARIKLSEPAKSI